MSETPKIYAAISAAMGDINPVGKDNYNAQQKFKYRGIDDVMNALYPVLCRHGLFIVPEVLEHTREERAARSGGNLIYSIIKMRYTMYATDGSSVSAVVIGEGMDSADKSSNKAMAVAMKYALFQLFCIPTEDMGNDDPDGHSPPDSTPQGAPEMPNSTPQGSTQPPDSTPQGKGNKTLDEIERIKAHFKTDDAGFAKMRDALIAGGIVQNKPSKEMTGADWEQLFAAIWKNFGGYQQDGPEPYYDERAMQEVP